MTTMRAISITKAGGPNVLKLTERPVPLARHGEVVIQLAYAGVNPVFITPHLVPATCPALKVQELFTPLVLELQTGQSETKSVHFCRVGDMPNMRLHKRLTVYQCRKAYRLRKLLAYLRPTLLYIPMYFRGVA